MMNVRSTHRGPRCFAPFTCLTLVSIRFKQRVTNAGAPRRQPGLDTGQATNRATLAATSAPLARMATATAAKERASQSSPLLHRTRRFIAHSPRPEAPNTPGEPARRMSPRSRRRAGDATRQRGCASPPTPPAALCPGEDGGAPRRVYDPTRRPNLLASEPPSACDDVALTPSGPGTPFSPSTDWSAPSPRRERGAPRDPHL